VITLLTRTVVLLPFLRQTSLAPHERKLLAWLGPRGLSSLLLVMLAVMARVPGSEQIFAVTSLAVLISLVAHGTGMFWLTQRGLASPATFPFDEHDHGITIEQLHAMQRDNVPHVLADARAERNYWMDRRIAEGAVRLNPDEPVRSARELGLSQHATVVVYCA
jgi:sodium/hydrogen antiporter